jgi:hypothetical protein
MMVDPWLKAEECKHALDVCSEVDKRAVLAHLQQLWIAMGNEKSAGLANWNSNAEELQKLHADIFSNLSPSR